MARENILPLGAKVAEAGCPENAKGLIMICPGGGYSWLSPREADPVAQAFLAGGYAAAIVYTTVREDDKAPLLGNLPLRQLGEAAEFCRKNYPGLKLIVCGFSAGAHLAASLGTHFSDLQLPRPDGMILGYPVITSGEYAHRGSMANLAPVGEQEWYSLERYVTAETPPVFLWHTVTDPEVPVQNSLLFAEALSRANVSYELHLYPRGVHGLSLCTPEVDEPEKNRLADPHIAGWFALCLEWLGTVL
jgi:acetyl esterase/lipase